jgi:tetratricopeptide (TPR) repeat protein
MQKSKEKIWLSYVSYPVTTAVYFERALRKDYDVTTCGPMITPGIMKKWELENMKLEVKPQEIPLDGNIDIASLIKSLHPDYKPDYFIWIESVNGNYPQNIDKLNIPTVCYFIDSHLSNNLKLHLDWGKNFDFVFIAQKEYLPEFKKAGIKNVYWLPLGCDVEIHSKQSNYKKHDISFVGSIGGNTRRVRLLNELKSKFDLYYERCFWLDMAKVFSESKIVFNNAVKRDLNMRVFETLSSGSFLLTDNALNSGQDELFVDGEDLAVYRDSLIGSAVEFYLGNDELREAIAQRGQQLVHNAHTYYHRVSEMMKVVKSGKTNTPSAAEWREKSVQNTTVTPKDINYLKRSFVIPVLDYSPASKYNIKTLLSDLNKIDGNVILVFNNEDVANEIKDNNRIDYYSIMKKNVGVSRAWNIGMNMSQTPITFVMNADLHVQKEAVEKLEKGIINFSKAAITGPQGSFFNAYNARDLHYFDKGTFDKPMPVDAVSGFFFAAKTKYFHDCEINFDNRYTPCYFEEWDTGLQIKKANLFSYLIPSTEYDHEWSGSIRALRTIKYLNKEETAREILERNKKLFLAKWRNLVNKNGFDESLLESYWAKLIIERGNEYLINQNLAKAEEIFNELLKVFPKNKESFCNLGIIEYHKGNKEKAVSNFEKALEIDPNFAVAKENLENVINEKQ